MDSCKDGKELKCGRLEKVKKENKLPKCQFCGRPFNYRSNRRRHELLCSGNTQPKPKCVCYHCGVSFARKDRLTLHMKKCFDPSGTGRKTVGRMNLTPCLIENCGQKFWQKQRLIEHLTIVHKNEVKLRDTIRMELGSIEEFMQWKEQEEEATFSYFPAKSGRKLNSKPVRYFYCQHDGHGKPRTKQPKKTDRLNKKGRIKVGHFCIAKMKMIQKDDGKIEVEYFPTHSHSLRPEDFRHHPLSRDINNYINDQVSRYVSPAKILENLRKKDMLHTGVEDPTPTKIDVLTKRRLMSRSLKARKAQRMDDDDATSVSLMVSKIIADGQDAVLLYKPLGRELVHGPSEINNLPNSDDLFMLGIQTERQLDLLQMYCSKIVVVDGTQGICQDDNYRLLTVLVVEECRRGWPVAHFVSNRWDSATLQYFFRCLKARMGDDAVVNCVITGDDSALINAINVGFSTGIRHLLCQWHVINSFRAQLKPNSKEFTPFEELFNELLVVMNSREESTFLELRDAFIIQYSGDQRCSRFMAYLHSHYWGRSEKWAACYRHFPHGGINTTGHVESFHHRLKKAFLRRKVDRRLDDLLNILIRFELEDYSTRCSGIVSSPGEIRERHQRGLLLNDERIVRIMDKMWEVQPKSSEKSPYVVTQNSTCCSAQCYNWKLCRACPSLCLYLYTCNCPDTHPLCKHIHKVHSLVTRGMPEEIIHDFPDSDFYVLPTHDDEAPQFSSRYHRERTEVLNMLRDFTTDLEGNKFSMEMLTLVHSTLTGLRHGIDSLQESASGDQCEPSLLATYSLETKSLTLNDDTVMPCSIAQKDSKPQLHQ